MAKKTKATPNTERKEIIVRERVEANEVLAPEKTNAVVLSGPGTRVTLDENADPQSVTRILNDGWRRAQGGLVEIMRFGATLLAVREWLDDHSLSENGAKRGDPGYTGGLKKWLSDNCPDINYKTAYGYMCAAAGLRREARLADDVPLLAMMGEDPIPEARAEKLRKRVQLILADSTLGLLREAASAPQETAAKGGAREGAGRPQLEPSAETRAGAAWGLIGREIDRATAWRFERFLPEAMAREALSTIDLLRAALKDRLDEFGKGK